MPRNLNGFVIIPMLALTLIGILAIWSAEPDFFPQQQSSAASGLSKIFASQTVKQLVFAAISLLFFIGIIFINYYRLKDYAYVIYLLFLGLVLILVVWGRVSHGARRWFQIGPFAFQPSEFMKIALILALGRLMMHKNNIARLKDFIPPILVTLIPLGAILLQPHLGTAMVFFPTFIVMLFVAGARRKDLFIMLLIIIILVPAGYFFVLKDYQRYRLISFLDPSQAPTSDGFQLIQSRVAVGSGGFIGRGWGMGESRGSLFVPERHNDFIFTTVSEEWGFMGSSLIIFLYLLMYVSAIFIAYNTREPFGRLVIIGLVTYLTIQTFINIGMTIGLAPITGLPLPFVSYGGSALLSSYMAMGLIINIGMRQLPSFAGKDFE